MSMSLKHELTLHLQDILKQLGLEGIIPHIDYPSDSKHGDYATNIALIVAKRLGKNPMEAAGEIVKTWHMAHGTWHIVEKMEIAKPGFINFWISDGVLVAEAEKIANGGAQYTGGAQNL